MRYVGLLTYQEAFSWLEAVPLNMTVRAPGLWFSLERVQQAHSYLCGCDVCCLLPRHRVQSRHWDLQNSQDDFFLYMLIISDIYYNQRNVTYIFINEEYEEIMVFTFQVKHRLLFRSSHPKCHDVQWVSQQNKVRNMRNCTLCFRLLPWLYHGSFF